MAVTIKDTTFLDVLAWWKFTDILEEYTASVFRVEELTK
jgi:hypothetical protein